MKMKKPDWKCVFTYVQSFYRRFRNGREKQSPTKTLVLERPPSPVRIINKDNSGFVRGPNKKEYVLKSDPVVKPFESYKNYVIKPLPQTVFNQTNRPKINSNTNRSISQVEQPSSNFNRHYRFPFSRINSLPITTNINISNSFLYL